ncbi:MAG TPA: thioredoxin family protein [Ignavibacteriaceae bacterium]
MFRSIILNLVVITVIIFSYAFSLSTEKFENFTLKDYKGKEHSLSDYKNSKAIVLIFIATECPVSNAYNLRMEKIYQDYKDKGVQLIGINSNKSESVSDIRSHAIKNNLTFTILKDEKNIIADKFKASFTPEVFVLDSDFNLLYHGRIDDSRREEDIKVQDLRNTLDEILSGKQISNPKTKAFGCTIKRV